jgi:hypothetical protein
VGKGLEPAHEVWASGDHRVLPQGGLRLCPDRKVGAPCTDSKDIANLNDKVFHLVFFSVLGLNLEPYFLLGVNLSHAPIHFAVCFSQGLSS